MVPTVVAFVILDDEVSAAAADARVRRELLLVIAGGLPMASGGDRFGNDAEMVDETTTISRRDAAAAIW